MAVPRDDRGRRGAFRLESTLDPVLGAVLPVFGLVASGYLAGRFGLVTQASSAALNQFVYAFALPAMLFIAVYRGSLEEILSGYFLLAVILATLGTAAVGFVVSHWSHASPAESTMRALNASFANTGYLGIPLVTVAYGERAHRAFGGRRVRPMRDDETDGGGSQRGEDHREQEIAAENLLERAAVHGDEQHRRQREGIDELVERRARGLGDQPEAAGEIARGDQPEDRQHRAEDRV